MDEFGQTAIFKEIFPVQRAEETLTEVFHYYSNNKKQYN